MCNCVGLQFGNACLWYKDFTFSDANMKAVVGFFGAKSDINYECMGVNLAWCLETCCHLVEELSLLFILVLLIVRSYRSWDKAKYMVYSLLIYICVRGLNQCWGLYCRFGLIPGAFQPAASGARLGCVSVAVVVCSTWACSTIFQMASATTGVRWLVVGGLKWGGEQMEPPMCSK